MDKMLKLKQGLSLKKYSLNTINTYMSCAENIVKKHGEYPNIGDVKGFLCSIKNHNTHAQYVSAIKHYFWYAHRVKIDLDDIPYPRKSKPLPKALSQEDCKKLVNIPKLPKHQVIILLLYGCGLRMNELLNLKWTDIDRSAGVIHIRNGKGGKDRDVMLPEKLISELTKYYRTHKPTPKVYVVEGVGNRIQYSATSVNALLNTWAKRAGIKKHVSAHMLRHSFATHLLDAGTDMVKIQELMGHNNSKTTQIYAKISTKHISKTPSPLSFL